MSTLAMLQGLYFFIMGIWPILSIRTFMAVTGPKVDTWLVQTVGALTTVMGLVLLQAAYREAVSPEVVSLAMGESFAFMAVDLTFVLKKRIAPIYLADALVELILIVCWALLLLKG